MAVADGFAWGRVSGRASAPEPGGVVREIGWAEFGELARELSQRIARRYQPNVVLGIAKGGIFVGGAVAAALQVDFHPVRIEKRSRDKQGPDRVAASKGLPNVRGLRVLIVDDVAASGQTLEHARQLARKAGALEVQAAVLTVRPDGAKPEWYALETDGLVVFAWDYQLDQAGPAGGGDAGDPGNFGV